MNLLRFWGLNLVGLSLLLALFGCGGGPPKHFVKGTITDGGKVLPVVVNESKSGQWLRMWLIPTEPEKAGEVQNAQINFADGTFTLGGSDGRGIPAGRYKVCLEWNEKFPLGKDLLHGKFSEAKSKTFRDIPPPNNVLDIDVSKPEG